MNSEHSIGRTCKRTAKSGSQRKVGFRRISANKLDAPTVGNGILHRKSGEDNPFPKRKNPARHAAKRGVVVNETGRF
jgi:hypothetical protein